MSDPIKYQNGQLTKQGEIQNQAIAQPASFQVMCSGLTPSPASGVTDYNR
jgi:hypothetical protein